jgi:hypothetical protein
MRPIFLSRRQRLLYRVQGLARAVITVAACIAIGWLLAEGF